MIDEYLKRWDYIGPIAETGNTVYWYKKMPNTMRHQIIVRQWKLLDNSNFSYEIEMTYETKGDIWATVKFYGLNEETLKVNLRKLALRLQQSLVGMGANPQHYRYDGQD